MEAIAVLDGLALRSTARWVAGQSGRLPSGTIDYPNLTALRDAQVSAPNAETDR